jgi:hypothetical protein
MKRLSAVPLLFVLALSGCFHATVETGLTPSGDSIHVPWAHSFVVGLAPPATVETAQRCPNGVARTETQHSVLNMLAWFVTAGIYTPMTIKVHCAAARVGAAGGRDGAPTPPRPDSRGHQNRNWP